MLMVSSLKKSSLYNKYEIRKRNLDPKACALLVIDMQNYFSSIANSILSSLSTIIRLCRYASIPITFTCHCHKSPSDYSMLDEWWNGDPVFDGTFAAELITTLDWRSEDMAMEKNTYNALRNTQLEEKLVEMGVKEVIVTRVMTNICCETTAHEAFLRGFRVCFSANATTTSDLKLHEAALKNMAYGFAYLLNCQRLQDALSVK